MVKIDDGIIRVKAPARSEVKTMRILICCGLLSMIIFVQWFSKTDHIGYAPIFWLLTFALSFKLIKMLHEWYHYWRPSVPVLPTSKREWKVDVLTTACPGEPREMIIRTLRAMKEIRYPHTNYLCDEGDDPILKEICKSLGVIHVTRTDKTNAKAGNINNALKQASGEIAVVLDPDHVPIPEFLDRVLAYFEDESIGYVQCVQGYGNQEESFIARGAAEQTYTFYGPMMMCMNSYGTVQAIGANCTFRRSALDSIGGHAPGLAEDMHTAMQLHAKGWKSIYVPEMLTRGLVPATLSAYYKQQLKWSRGTFDLLFYTFPKLYKNFTWRQKIHYLTIPMYFLFGLINLIDILVPVIALGLAQIPWQLDLQRFALYFFPLCILSLCVRLYAQRWLLEKHERGFHMAGGVLRTATWWIFLIGFIYTIFNIKVPYIPTPKEDEHQNYVRMSIPNILVFILCTVIIYYGLKLDWTPYSIMMASYSMITIAIMGFTVLLSQQKFMKSVSAFFSRIPVLAGSFTFVAKAFYGIQQMVYSTLKQGVVVLILAFSSIFLSYNSIDAELENELMEKSTGSFYTGVELSPNGSVMHSLISGEKENAAINLISFKQSWSDTTRIFSADLINDIRFRNCVPFISWQAQQNGEGANIYNTICDGVYDAYLKRCATLLRNYRDPVFISFTNTNSVVKSSSAEFVKAWQYIYTYFNNLGISNITWVWSPKDNKDVASYPGEKFVDWIGVSCLNYGAKVKGKDWYSFASIYEPYRKQFGKFKKPVMITEFGCLKGADQTKWFTQAFNDIEKNYKEIKSLIIKNGRKHFELTSYTADFGLGESGLVTLITDRSQSIGFKTLSSKGFMQDIGSPERDYKSKFISGKPGEFQLKINNQPFYIKGVAYNTAHDWRDGNMPLTRRQIEKDFKYIKEMGANTIRRYGTGIYDRNVLNIADESDLKVQFGFWFDPKVDYFSDSVKVRAYIASVEEKVRAYKDHPSVIAWSLGNESWGLLKHTYSKPYLTMVRSSYVKLIEHLAQRIHEIDPTRPVFTSMEHEEYQLPGELVSFRDGAPSIDVIGVNSYYRQQISNLNHLVYQFDSLRPYLVSEFGPNGYWDPKYNKVSGSSIAEQSDKEKAEWYKIQWTAYVEGYKGYNVGGFAYCWHDRMEGSYTWFGLTDFKGRPKPSYYALKELWTNKREETLCDFSIQGPAQLVPGQTYSFSASHNGKANTSVEYEWRLLKDEYLDEVDVIEYTNDPSCIQFTIPSEASNYRLYVFVSNENGDQVTTASLPIKVIQRALQ